MERKQAIFVRRRAMELRCDDRSISTTTKESVVLQLQDDKPTTDVDLELEPDSEPEPVCR